LGNLNLRRTHTDCFPRSRRRYIQRLDIVIVFGEVNGDHFAVCWLAHEEIDLNACLGNTGNGDRKGRKIESRFTERWCFRNGQLGVTDSRH